MAGTPKFPDQLRSPTYNDSEHALPWLPGGEPRPGRVARIRFRSYADVSALARVPAESLLPGTTVYSCLTAAAAVDPDKTAITHLLTADPDDAPREVTYAELIDHVNRAANLFASASKGDPVSVAIILPMIPEALLAAWAASAVGVATPINPYLGWNYTISIMNAARATVLVTNRLQLESAPWRSTDGIFSQVPTLRRVLLVDSRSPGLDYETAVASSAATLSFEPVCDPDATATYQLTGGSTGAPKLIRLTHRGQLINAWLNGALHGTAFEGAMGHAMPNFHIGGAVVIALRTMLFSQTLVTLTTDGFRNVDVVRNFWEIARKHRLTAVLATPTTAAAILAATGTTAEGHCISAFGCGGSIVPLALSRAFHARFGVWLRDQWGLSEAQGTVTGHMIDQVEPLTGSVGRVFPYYRLKAIEVDSQNRFVRECDPGERGLLAVAGPLTPSYVNTRLNSDFFVTGGPEGSLWGNTGDLGSIDEDGYVWVFGRSKDVIVRGGHNIDPKLVEDVLITHPTVQLAAAVGRPDAVKGELPVAYVQLKAGANATAQELIEFCRQNVQERASVPVEIVLLEVMPMTQVGKISKPALRIDSMRRMATSVARTVVGSRAFEIRIDESGKRPKLFVSVDCRDPEQVALCRALEAAFAGFEFQSVIECVSRV